MTDIWTNPVDRVLRELISPAIWNADLAANLRVLSGHSHTGAAGDGAIISATRVNSGLTTYFITNTPVVNSSSPMVGAANQVRVLRFFLPFGLSLGSFTFNIQTLSAATTAGIGIYNAGGTSLLASGTVSTASTGVKRVSITPVTLPIDFYLLAWTNTSNVPAWYSLAVNANPLSTLNDTNPQLATAANASAAGVLPSTTGALTAASVDIPTIKLEGS